MRRFDDLTDDEVLALSDEQVERYIDLECAYTKVPLLPPMPTEPPKRENTPDAMVYEVDGAGVCGFYFARAEDAAAVMALANTFERATLEWVNVPGEVHRKVGKAHGDLKVMAQTAYSAPTWAAISSDMTRAAEAHKAYEQEKKYYDAAVAARQSIVSAIHDRIADVQARARRQRRMRETFDRYLSLANGDHAIARQFLRDAHPDATELVPEVFGPATVAAEDF